MVFYMLEASHNKQNQLIGDLESAYGKLEEQAREIKLADETKAELISILSHDLRSPFAGIIGLAEQIQSKSGTMDAVKQRRCRKHLLLYRETK